MKCAWRSCNNEVIPNKIGPKNKKFCSRECNLKDKVCRYRLKRKIRAVEFLGGRCSRCGYNRCLRALQFHHVNPEDKEFGISRSGCTRSWERDKKELLKCILLCANCHAEEEDIQLGIRLNVKTLPC